MVAPVVRAADVDDPARVRRGSEVADDVLAGRQLARLLVVDADDPEVGEAGARLTVRAFVDEDAVVALLARLLLRIGDRLVRGEKDSRAVVGPLDRPDRSLVVGELRGLAAARHPQEPDLRAGRVAVVLGLIAGREKRDVASVRRPRRRAILVAAEQLALIAAVGIGDPDRRHPLVVGPLLELRLRVDDVRAVGRDLGAGDLDEIEQIVERRRAAILRTGGHRHTDARSQCRRDNATVKPHRRAV